MVEEIGKTIKVVEYSPQKRTVLVNERDDSGRAPAKYHIQFPYMLFAFNPSSRLIVGFMTEAWHPGVKVHFPSLPNIYEDWYSCQEIAQYLNPTINHFWHTVFSGNSFRGVEICSNKLGGFKKWQSLDLEDINKRMDSRWFHVNYENWLFRGRITKKPRMMPSYTNQEER
tara:strand:+ start:1662 stop:2171 length:510 start_codon:yes stop_codon:yes gene_type:complete